MFTSSTKLGGSLQTRHIRAPKVGKVHSAKIPWGRIAWTADPGEAGLFATEFLTSNLTARHFDGDGQLIGEHDLGSGVVTAVGALALANDFGWASPSGAAINTLHVANQHFSGTGTTPAAISDIAIQTISTQGGQTAVAGAQTQAFTSAGRLDGVNYPKYQTVGTISYAGAESVTEWGLMTGATLTATTGTPFTAGTATTGTVTATPLTASSTTVQGSQLTVFHNTGNAIPSWGLVTQNTTSIVTVPAWIKASDATAGATPANGNAYTIRPVMFDHRIFSVITVGSGDSIQYTYQLALQTGG